MKKRIIHILIFTVLLISIDRGVGILLNHGLNRYFGLNEPSKVLLIGHSHLMLATNKSAFEKGIGKPVSKYCREGVNVEDRYVMIKHFLSSKHSDSLKYVLYGVDQFMFTGAGLSKNSYKLFYPFMDVPVMNNYIKSSATTSYDYWLHKLVHSSRYSDALINSAIRGWRYDWSNYKSGQLDIKVLQEQIATNKQRKIDLNKELIQTFENTLQLLTQRNISVILVNTPIAMPLNEYEPDSYRHIISYFQEITKKNRLISYWDYNPVYSNNYSLFFDPIHLNPKGQEVITQELIQNFNALN